MKILVTGIGITGKSTFRRKLVTDFRKRGLKTEHFDADCFEEIRHPIDKDCLEKLPEIFDPEINYIIEDVHGPLDSAVLPLKEYDLIYYIKSYVFSHILFWLSRMWIWFQTGNFSWKAGQGWEGAGKTYDLNNVLPIFKNFFHDLKNRRRWLKKDLKSIASFKYKIVRSKWTKHGIKFFE